MSLKIYIWIFLVTKQDKILKSKYLNLLISKGVCTVMSNIRFNTLSYWYGVIFPFVELRMLYKL
jgi:hypothetical protein